LSAQDIHFSQFNNSPLNLNPALTGNYNATYRFTGNSRTQWRSVTIPYQTMAFAAEVKEITGLKNMAIGLALNHDQAGDSKLSTIQVNPSIAYSIPIKKYQQLTLGVQPGMSKKSFGNDLTFDNQYFGIEANENFANYSISYFNLNSGLNWRIKNRKNNIINAGISVFNINRPEQSFFGTGLNRLDRRLNINSNINKALGRKTRILPGLLYSRQGTYQEITIGSDLRYDLSDKPYLSRAVYAGIWSRAGDAVIMTSGFEYNSLYFGISYDFNYSSLIPASNYRGGVEISIIYLLTPPEKRKNYKICPLYL
jgi:type IX secretion system PorP/SprF family membrane protein